MLRWGREGDWIAHSITGYNEPIQSQFGIARSILSKNLLKDFSWNGWNTAYDAALWNWMRPQGTKYKTIELWNLLDIRQIQ